MAFTRRRFVETLGVAGASVLGGSAHASQGGPPYGTQATSPYARGGAP